MHGEIACCNHSTLTWYHLLLLLIIIIMIMIMIIMIIIWKGYFSVNPIYFSFRNFNVVIAFKYL